MYYSINIILVRITKVYIAIYLSLNVQMFIQFQIKANDDDKGIYGKLTYSLSGDGVLKDSTMSLFTINNEGDIFLHKVRSLRNFN